VRTALGGGLIGAALFVAVLGTAIVRPSNLGWTMRHDLQTYVLAWTHFRHEPWHWPPGRIDGIGYPVGTSIGNTDAIPVVAFALKPFQALMPEPSQFLGAWLLLCFVLQGVFGALLVGLATPDWRLRLLGAALFVQTPALFNRLGHPALCAHWLLLAAIWLLVEGMRGDRAWHRAAWLGLAALVGAVQPYLAGMVLLLALAAFANRAWRAGTWTRAAAGFAAESAALGLVMGGVFWVCGYFLISSADLQFEGLGLLSMNLLGPIMGMGYTTLLPEIPLAVPGQYEGHVYFGMGWLVLTGVAVALRARARAPVARFGAGWLAVAACTAIAVSPVVTFGTATLVDLREWAPASLATFRSSGRFGWVTMYTAFTFVALTLVTRLPRRAATAAFAAAIVVQGVDMNAAYRALHARERNPAWTDYDSPVKSAAWTVVVPAYRHLVMVPPDMCAAVWSPVAGPHLPFSLLAGTHGVTINSGNAGRYDTGAVLRYCATLEADVRAGRVSDDSLYVLSPAMRAALAAATPVPLSCGVLDGVDVCVTAASAMRWRDEAGRAGFAATVIAPAR
jgi:hypothetical protein